MIQDKLKSFDEIVSELREILIMKNNDYGSNEVDNIRDLGEKGIFVRIWDKCCRLRTLVWLRKEAQVQNETIDDTLKDLANYAVINLILRRGGWK